MTDFVFDLITQYGYLGMFLGMVLEAVIIIIPSEAILATGGKSYPLTGSTGDGYKIAKALGHTIVPIKPSLVPLEVYEKEECKKLQGLSVRNVGIKFIDTDKKKIIYEDFEITNNMDKNLFEFDLLPAITINHWRIMIGIFFFKLQITYEPKLDESDWH